MGTAVRVAIRHTAETDTRNLESAFAEICVVHFWSAVAWHRFGIGVLLIGVFSFGGSIYASRYNKAVPGHRTPNYSTVTDFARFLGWSTSHPRLTAM